MSQDEKNATWYSYSHDLTKNVTELYQSDGLIATTYDYSPYGATTAEGIDQPLQWSSEYHDPELALIYYNYRHYNPTDGRWIVRDPIGMQSDHNLYAFVGNNVIIYNDSLGLASFPWDGDWGSGNTSRGNCYRFACNDPMLPGEPHFKRPNNILPDMRGNFTCNEVTKNLPKHVKKSGNNGACPKCYYKIQVVIRPKNILMQDPKKRLSDFHFYRQNPNGSWSHKPGNTPVINNVIDPGADARRSNYTENCGAYCVPEGGENVD